MTPGPTPDALPPNEEGGAPAGPVAVALCVDEAMAMPLGVTIASILTSRDPGTELAIHVVGLGLSAQTRRRLEAITAGRAALTIHDPQGEMRATLERVFVGSDRPYPPSNYARLLLGRILPDLDRVIYLDADLAIVRDLRPLWSTDMDGTAVLAVLDIASHQRRMDRLRATLSEADRARYGFDMERPYFSAGVMVLDLNVLRGGVDLELFDLISRYPSLNFPDQDALNIILGPRSRLVDPRWNQTSGAYWDDALVNSRLSPEGLEQLRADPWIVHYSGRPKPWEHGCTHPHLAAWTAAYEQTPWARLRHGSTRQLLSERLIRAQRKIRKEVARLLRPRQAGRG